MEIDGSVQIVKPIYLHWQVSDIGFGEIYIYEQDGKLYCDNELMSKDFIKAAFCKLIDECELTCPAGKDIEKN